MKNKKCHTVVTFPESHRQIVERCKIDTSNLQIHDRSISVCGTGTSIKCGRVKLVLWTPLSDMMKSCFPHVSKMPTLTYNPANRFIKQEIIFKKFYVGFDCFLC